MGLPLGILLIEGTVRWGAEVVPGWGSGPARTISGRMRDIYGRAMASTDRQNKFRHHRWAGTSMTSCPSLSVIQDLQI